MRGVCVCALCCLHTSPATTDRWHVLHAEQSCLRASSHCVGDHNVRPSERKLLACMLPVCWLPARLLHRRAQDWQGQGLGTLSDIAVLIPTSQVLMPGYFFMLREVDESEDEAFIQDFIDNLERQQAGDSNMEASPALGSKIFGGACLSGLQGW